MLLERAVSRLQLPLASFEKSVSDATESYGTKFSFADYERVQGAFSAFSDEINDGYMDEIVAYVRGKDVILPSWGRFILSPLLLGGGVVKIGSIGAEIVADQHAGFALGHTADTADDATWFAYTGFAPAALLNHYAFSDPESTITPSYSDESPVITQLQAIKVNDSGLQALNQTMLQSFSWPKASVFLMGLFATSVHSPSLHVLPAEINIYYPGRELRFRNRYNLTAEQCGFQRDEFGMYTKILSGGNSSPLVSVQ